MTAKTFRHPEALVSGQWLEAHLDDRNLRIFDCTTYLDLAEGDDAPYRVVSARPDYDAGHIPGSVHLDLQEDFSVEASPYRFTLPSAEAVGASFARHGVGDDTRVVLYSRKSLMWSTRFWWMLRWIGFDAAAILDGGYDKWAADGRPVSTQAGTYPLARLTVKPRTQLFVGKNEVLDSIGNTKVCTINALGPDVHSGQSDRYGRPGRVPGSINVPAGTLLNSQTLEILDPDTVGRAFAGAGADPAKRTIAYCGGGIAATMDAFLLHQLGFEDVAVYDNSMSEWATDDTLPMETG